MRKNHFSISGVGSNSFIMDRLKEHREHKERLLGMPKRDRYVNEALDKMLTH